MYKFIIKDNDSSSLILGESDEIEMSHEDLDYIFEYFEREYLRHKKRKELIVENDIIKLLSKGDDYCFIDNYLERITDDYGNVVYQCDGENVTFISDYIKDAFSSFAKELDDLENEIGMKILWASSFEIIYGSIFPYSERESICTMIINDLDLYKEKILSVANYNISNLEIPQSNFRIEDIDNNSFSYTNFITEEKIRIIRITQKCDRVNIGLHFHYNPRIEGCVFSTGELTNNIKHCSNIIKEWIENINKDIENINDIAIKNWNFLD